MHPSTIEATVRLGVLMHIQLAQVPSDILTPDRAINAQVASNINSANLIIIPQMTEANQIGN